MLNYFVAYEISIYEEQGKYLAKVSSNGLQIQSESLAYVTGDEIVGEYFLRVEHLD